MLAAAAVVAGSRRHRPARHVAEHVVVEHVLAGARIRNLPEERLPLAVALHCEDHVGALLRRRGCPVVPCRGDQQESGVAPTDGILSACNRSDQTALSFAVALWSVVPWGCDAAQYDVAVVPHPAETGGGTDCAAGHAAAGSAVAGRKRCDYGGFRMIAHPSHARTCALACDHKSASGKVRQR